MYVQVNIGRNIDGEPMPDAEWANFISDVADSLRMSTESYSSAEIETHFGVGIWEDEQEESAHVSMTTHYPYDIEQLRKLLEVDRIRYQQKSIALIAGSELIEGE